MFMKTPIATRKRKCRCGKTIYSNSSGDINPCNCSPEMVETPTSNLEKHSDNGKATMLWDGDSWYNNK